MLAARGTRDLDDGEHPIEEEDVKEALRAQAKRVWARSVLLASAATAVLYFAPF